MSSSLHIFLSLDLPPLVAGSLAALCCGLLGNFLVLRRQSLMGDAISHAVLPGLVAAFLVTSLRTSLPMFIGALIAGLVTVALVDLVRRVGRVESGAAMGVVFSIMFALGVVLLEQAAARHVDLDADCVFNGQLETITWFPPSQWADFWSWSTVLGSDAGTGGIPRQITALAGVTLVVMGFLALFFKELRISSFDPALAGQLGFRPGLLNSVLMALVAAAAVASFEAVGSILVVAMLICPAATARLLTDSLRTQIVISAVVAVASAVAGYVLGAHAPVWMGFENGLSAAGMITVVSGALLGAAIVLSPSHGLLAKALRRLRLSSSIAREDLLSMLYRLEELRLPAALTPEQCRDALGAGALASRLAMRRALRRGQIRARDGRLGLEPQGREIARSLIRRHRLWESYLVRELGLRADHVHGPAEILEHIQVPPPDSGQTVDPHNKPIPPSAPGGDVSSGPEHRSA